MINNTLKEPIINNKESLINDILQKPTINNNLEEETINNLEKSTTLEEPTINNNLKEKTINNNSKEKINNKKSANNNSTFVKTPECLRSKRVVLNTQNNDINLFNILLHFLCIMNTLEKIAVEYQRLNHMSTILIGKTLIIHQHNNIFKILK